ncbi:DUF11 domain-containing protein [Methanimicrococcus blatticola]|uniref:Putative repeat protein (TIGR01451 family) n=1 Tax=Methanimicrococcus blatticola TaxID=91560 RepID=A0A484F272_9EURY|nr:DUF11 domain-containing protein [Methanimicrococcus blatticola]MBZ3936352.1 hypothetical protein [Methanimicrococcus blatticola]MCC2509514.1 DUF11 domain-containing protein [Methanimicrococcus blatticola]TDQ67567.1 putative repeat protein (TIGR01451 family) [Methanimicrococcus blatticola]
MKLIKYGAGLLFFTILIMAVISPAAAWQKDDWLEGGDGYMINNVIIEASAIAVTTDEDNSSNTSGNASISIYEWKNDKWERINGTKLSLNQTMSFTAADGNYTVRAIDFRESGRFNQVRLEFWSNADITNSGYVDGGHSNAEGAGKPNLIVTKVLSPATNISVDDVVMVTIYVENKGNYDAKNVTINDHLPEGFMQSNITINNTVNQTINKNTNNTYKIYQIKAVEPGNKNMPPVEVTAENALGVKYDYKSNGGKNVTIEVSDLAALVFTPAGPSGNTVDYYTRSKIDGNITIRNIGTMPAQYVSVQFQLPTNATISGKDINVTGDTATMYIDLITPNNQKVIEYSLSATSEGYYEVPITYSYTYNNSAKTGGIQTVTYNAIGSNTIETALDYWFLLLIPVIIIGVAALFIWKRHREYKF